MALLPVYGLQKGLGAETASLLLTMLVIGGVVGPFPVLIHRLIRCIVHAAPRIAASAIAGTIPDRIPMAGRAEAIGKIL